MDLKELRYYRAIAELGSFSKAAAFLNVAQPALSRQIQKLEHDLGVELLRRTARGVTPTAAGQVLLSHTVDLEHEIANVRRDVSRFASQVVGRLNIATGAPVSTLMMPTIIKRYRELCPEVFLHVVEGYSGDSTERLLDRKIDIAVVDAPTHPHADFQVFPLWVETLKLVGPASERSSELFTSGPVDLSIVATLPLIVSDYRHALRRTIEAAFFRKGLKLRAVIEAEGYSLMLQLVKEGLGYALLPHNTFYDLLQGEEIAYAEVRPAIRRTISIVTRSELLGERIVGPLIDLIKEQAPLLAGTKRYGPAELCLDTNHQK